MKSYIIGLIIVVATLFAGCTTSQQTSACTGKAVLDSNGVLSVCTDGKLVSSCTGEGGVYSETATDKVVCKGGKWVKEAVSSGVPPANQSEETNGTATTGNTSSAPATSSATEEGRNCTGKTWVSVNGVTEACVNGKMTTECSEEGQVYKESLTIHKKIVCQGGKWAAIPMPANDTEDGPACTGKSSATINDVTNVCVDGNWTTKCTTEGEVYTQYEPIGTEVVCEGGVWVSRDIE